MPHTEDSDNYPIPRHTSAKKMLFVITQGEFGGAQRFISQLIANLDSSKFQCTVVSGSNTGTGLSGWLPPSVPQTIMRYLRRNPNLLSDIRALWELRGILLRDRPDILFLNSSKAGFIGSLAGHIARWQLPSLTVIYRIGGWSFHDPRPWYQRFIFRLLEKISAQWKDYIVVNNRNDFDAAQRLGISPRKKLILIHNGIDPYLDFLSPQEAHQELFKETFIPKTLIGTIANFYPTKGLDVFLEAMTRLPREIGLVIIGDGSLRKDLEAKIKNYGLEYRVILAGQLPDAWRYIPLFKIFVLSSLKEGFPWAVLEAMAAKVPVVATRVGAIPELIEDKQNGIIVPPGDSRSLAEAITTLLANDHLQQQYALAAHQTILKHFTLRHMVEQYEELFLN